MPENDIMVIAGKAGAKSTFGAGLMRHVKKMNRRSIVWDVVGNEEDFEKGVVQRMWTQGKYPEQTYEGYVVTYTVGRGTALVPTSRFKLVDLPGEEQKTLLDDNDLMGEIGKGNTPNPEDVEEDYEQNIRSDFEKGETPEKTEDWETVFLYNYYNADDAIFLINLSKVIYGDEDEDGERGLAYDVAAVETAVEQFTDVAVIPTAVDVVGYDPDESYQLSWTERFARFLRSPQMIDSELHETLDNEFDLGEAPHVVNILDYVDQEEEVDFFSVAVPGESIEDDNENLVEDPDDPGNFTVKGFDRVIEWL